MSPLTCAGWGKLRGSWMPAEPESFKVTLEAWAASRGVKAPLVGLRPSNFRIEFDDTMCSLGSKQVMRSLFVLDGAWHKRLSVFSLDVDGLVQYRCEEWSSKRVIVNANLPDGTHLRYTAHRQLSGRDVRLRVVLECVGCDALETVFMPAPRSPQRGSAQVGKMRVSKILPPVVEVQEKAGPDLVTNGQAFLPGELDADGFEKGAETAPNKKCSGESEVTSNKGSDMTHRASAGDARRDQVDVASSGCGGLKKARRFRLWNAVIHLSQG